MDITLREGQQRGVAMIRLAYPVGQRDTGRQRAGAADITVRLAGALLALAIAAVHVADQGGVTALGSPSWMGWGFRLVEVGGVLTAAILLLPRPARFGQGFPALAGWAAGLLLGAGPFAAYITSRTVGLPGDPHDVGNWSYWTGTVSLFVEAALVVLSISMLMSLRRHPAQATRAQAGPVLTPVRLPHLGSERVAVRQ